nr:coiled-coil domain-containing protein 200 [Marmota flaviventris]
MKIPFSARLQARLRCSDSATSWEEAVLGGTVPGNTSWVLWQVREGSLGPSFNLQLQGTEMLLTTLASLFTCLTVSNLCGLWVTGWEGGRCHLAGASCQQPKKHQVEEYRSEKKSQTYQELEESWAPSAQLHQPFVQQKPPAQPKTPAEPKPPIQQPRHQPTQAQLLLLQPEPLPPPPPPPPRPPQRSDQDPVTQCNFLSSVQDSQRQGPQPDSLRAPEAGGQLYNLSGPGLMNACLSSLNKHPGYSRFKVRQSTEEEKLWLSKDGNPSVLLRGYVKTFAAGQLKTGTNNTHENRPSRRVHHNHTSKDNLILDPRTYPPSGGAPFLEVLQYQVDAWSGRSKLLFHLPAPKIHLIYCPRIEDVSDIKLIRTDTTLDLSQKAEKR